MELYAAYIKEIGDIDIKYNDDFFFTYKITPTHIYLEDVFIKKEKRSKGKIEEILEEVYQIARENKLNFITSSICTNTASEIEERSHHILSKNGFIEYDKEDNMIYYSKELK